MAERGEQVREELAAGRCAVGFALPIKVPAREDPLGKIVEMGDVVSLFDNPVHPYTEGLLASIPRIEEDVEDLFAIEGSVPSPLDRPPGCAFAGRCRYVLDRCHVAEPPLVDVGGGRQAACFLAPQRARAEVAA